MDYTRPSVLKAWTQPVDNREVVPIMIILMAGTRQSNRNNTHLHMYVLSLQRASPPQWCPLTLDLLFPFCRWSLMTFNNLLKVVFSTWQSQGPKPDFGFPVCSLFCETIWEPQTWSPEYHVLVLTPLVSLHTCAQSLSHVLLFVTPKL